MLKYDPATREALRRSASYVDLGLRLALIILGGSLGGWWLDKKLNLLPWLTLLGTALGLLIGFYWFIMALRDLERKDNQTEEKPK